MARYINATLEDVKFHIESKDFDGPIDLLVQFVKESKIDVMDIFVSDLTSQYVKYVNSMQELDYEFVAGYLIFAALLTEIKSSKLLPYYPTPDEDYSGEWFDYDDSQPPTLDDIEREIKEQIRKKLLNDCPEHLKPREVINVFYPEPKYDESDYKLIAKNLTLEKLVDAYKLILGKVEIEDKAPKIQKIVKDRFTVAEKVNDIAEKVRINKKISFFGLFEKDNTKTEVLTIFLAILEVVRRQVAKAMQENDGDDIVLVHSPETDNENNAEVLTNDIDEYN